MRTKMTIRKAFLFGASLGGALALFFLLNYWVRPFPMVVNDWLDSALLEVCPFYALGFSNALHSWARLIAIALVGNAILYGVFGVLILLLYRLLRRAIQPSPS